VWTSAHRERSNEISLGNENFSARKPISVELKRGWNKVLIKLPVGEFSTKETRLVKWMFTFAFTTPDGKHAAPGLIYSPQRIKD
ncbi:MAG: beta-N-acetylhexosaminidase, partial [Muribaculaceae bacterium]|nr:beta-N-acetylhexosaminidase [Muribaculaceae bacterium]